MKDYYLVTIFPVTLGIAKEGKSTEAFALQGSRSEVIMSFAAFKKVDSL